MITKPIIAIPMGFGVGFGCGLYARISVLAVVPAHDRRFQQPKPLASQRIEARRDDREGEE
jgi:hypothetical protein